MSKSQFSLLFLLLALSLSIFSCRPRRDLIPTVDQMLKSPDRAIRAVHAHHSDFNTFSARFSGTAAWKGNNHHVSGTIRIHKDKAIWVSVAPFLGIEISRILITPDSVKFLNRLEASYFVGDINYLQTILGQSLDYFMLQDLFMGNDFKNFSSDNFSIFNDRELILLRSNNRQKNNHQSDFRIEQNIWIDPADFRIRQTEVISPEEQRKIIVRYNQMQSIENQLLPSEIDLTFSEPGNFAAFKLKFTRMTLNAPQEFSFSIPARYNQIEM
ncbi:MAG TPA: DUF4292 domain-containing protein [Bacteroidales bacterium]|nr:DUF4292 domain-containing protein [Bacteroidales bacterium]